MTDAKQWQRAKDVFQAALDRPREVRGAFVMEQCSDDAERAEVMRLLRMHDESSRFLKSPIESESAVPTSAADPLIGHTIGGFRILRRLGAGGMGAVYEAQQQQPHRRVAIKVMRPGFATHEALRRLEFEAEILASLQHPGIAHVYAAGTFDIGDGAQPWFAMELLDGRPLHEFLGARPLSLRHRIELLLMICDAVQHAHQRGVVHRDLKPANIIVVERQAPAAGAATRQPSFAPVILDFGVARVAGAGQHVTMHTAVGELVGTLSYMSPEQLAGAPDNIDVRCDVYALGVIGYELLSGRLPYQSRSSTVADIVRAIEQHEPRRLGLIEPACRGDLETVFAKALEKDRQRRYQSAVELAADLQRYLDDEPVLARPATPMYQLRKFARRNRTLVGGVLATMAALLAGTVLYALEAHRSQLEAERSKYEADKATAINNFMTNDFLMSLLAAANGQQAGERIPVEQLIDRAAAQIGAIFAEDPLGEAAVRNEVGTVYYNIGSFEKSAQQFAAALDVWEAKLGPDHADTLKAVNNLGQACARRGMNVEAEALYRRAVDGRVRVLGEDDPFALASMNNLANLLRWTGRLDEAEALMRRTLEIQQRVHGRSHKHTLITMRNLGVLLNDRGKAEDALPMLREAYGTCAATFGGDNVTTLSIGTRLGQTLQLVGDTVGAESLLADMFASLLGTLGSEHADTILARRTLADVYVTQGRLEAATAQLESAIIAAQTNPALAADLAHEIQGELDAINGAAATIANDP